jgi:aminobenzoyl-glutamate utilization protein A
MKEKIKAVLDKISAQILTARRDFHKYPEIGWTEFRTASLIARKLYDLGFDVKAGKEVMDGKHRMGLPSEKELSLHWERARAQGGDSEFLEKMKEGYTGVVASMRNGEGPCIALRFDMDALSIEETRAKNHLPFDELFSSENLGVMHACGHDGHSAIGLGVAQLMHDLKEDFHGTLKLIFQPAEEGVRGAKSMLEAGVVDDVDYFVGHHLFPGWRIGELICGMNNFAATQKMDVTFYGAPAHAGSNPQGGANAILAAATAILNLHAIERHSDGSTRINVGRMEAGAGRNVICSEARLEIEVRGEDTDICDFVARRAQTILKAAAEMHNCRLDFDFVGEAENVRCDSDFSEYVAKIAEAMGYECMPPLKSAGSEDISWFMNRVNQNGGQATLIGIGADRFGIGLNDKENRDKVLVPHTSSFDFDELILPKAVELLANIVFALSRNK